MTKRDASSNHPRWSPDGNLLYYQSCRDGFNCIWAQQLNPDTKEPVGEPFGVYHSHSARRALGNVSGAQRIWVSVARDKMVFSMERSGERSGTRDRGRRRSGGEIGGRSGTAPELGNLFDADRHPEHEDCRPMCSHINALTAFPDAEWPNSIKESLPKKSPQAARSGSE